MRLNAEYSLSTVSRRAPVRRLIQSLKTGRDMLNDPGQWFAFALSGWTTIWPTQLLAIIAARLTLQATVPVATPVCTENLI